MKFKEFMNRVSERATWKDLFNDYDLVEIERSEDKKVVHLVKRPDEVIALQKYVMNKNDGKVDWVVPGFNEAKHLTMITFDYDKKTAYYKDEQKHVIRAWQPCEGELKPWEWHWEVLYVDGIAFSKKEEVK